MKKFGFIALVALLSCGYQASLFAQRQEITHTMAYTTVTVAVKGTGSLRNYAEPGKDAVCGLYSEYNNCLYFCDGTMQKELNEDFISDASTQCCDTFFFDNGERPYAMLEFDVEIKSVDYETNTIYARGNGTDITITTYNKEIDLIYEKFYKRPQLGPTYAHFILRNWNYTPESEDSYANNALRVFRKTHFKAKKTNTNEDLLHEVEYQKAD